MCAALSCLCVRPEAARVGGLKPHTLADELKKQVCVCVCVIVSVYVDVAV